MHSDRVEDPVQMSVGLMKIGNIDSIWITRFDSGVSDVVLQHLQWVLHNYLSIKLNVEEMGDYGES